MPKPLAFVSDPPAFSSLEILASSAGVRVSTKRTIRFPAAYLSELMRTVEQYGLSGRISIDYDTQGKPGAVTWEGAP